jgi:hypothetical protein
MKRWLSMFAVTALLGAMPALADPPRGKGKGGGDDASAA